MKNFLLELLLRVMLIRTPLFSPLKKEKKINMKEEQWNKVYDEIVRLVGGNIVYISDKVKCYVQDRQCKHLYQQMNVEKLRYHYVYNGLDDDPVDEIWVTVNDGLNLMKTISIPRKSNGVDTEIREVEEVFNQIIKLFSTPKINEDEEWANSPQEE